MEEVLKQLNELCRDTLVDNLGMVFTAAGEGWLEARMPENRFHVFGIEVNGNHMKQAQGGYVVAKGTFIHQGKRTHVVQVEIRDEYGTLVTVNRVTNMIV